MRAEARSRAQQLARNKNVYFPSKIGVHERTTRTCPEVGRRTEQPTAVDRVKVRVRVALRRSATLEISCRTNGKSPLVGCRRAVGRSVGCTGRLTTGSGQPPRRARSARRPRRRTRAHAFVGKVSVNDCGDLFDNVNRKHVTDGLGSVFAFGITIFAVRARQSGLTAACSLAA